MTSIWHWLIVLLVVMLLFGAGRISGVMGDLGRGIKSFKKGLNEDDEPGAARPQPRLNNERPAETPTASAQPTADLDKR
jgi:sec-independent protein translocase protein TatA